MHVTGSISGALVFVGSVLAWNAEPTASAHGAVAVAASNTVKAREAARPCRT